MLVPTCIVVEVFTQEAVQVLIPPSQLRGHERRPVAHGRALDVQRILPLADELLEIHSLLLQYLRRRDAMRRKEDPQKG